MVEILPFKYADDFFTRPNFVPFTIIESKIIFNDILNLFLQWLFFSCCGCMCDDGGLWWVVITIGAQGGTYLPKRPRHDTRRSRRSAAPGAGLEAAVGWRQGIQMRGTVQSTIASCISLVGNRRYLLEQHFE